jgi:hypothetical protein
MSFATIRERSENKMYSVWKYEIPIQDDIELEMPLGAKPLSF